MTPYLLWIEVFSVLFSLLYIGGISKRKVWAWPFGILASTLAAFLFYHNNLYSETYLQVVYAILGVYGWRSWKRKYSANGSVVLHLREWNVYQHIIVCLVGCLFVGITGWFFYRFTKADFPFLDAFTSIFGIIATIMQARKVRSSWVYWIVLNTVSLTLYIPKGLDIYAALSMVFALLSVYGLLRWNAAIKSGYAVITYS